MSKYKELQIFLIHKFLLIIILVSVAEYGIIKILQRTLIPLMMNRFFGGTSLDFISAVGIAAVMIAILISIILSVIKLFLPQNIMQSIEFGGILSGEDPSQVQRSLPDIIVSELGARERALLLILVLAIVIIMIIPYAVGAFFYARIVVREIRKIEANEKAMQKEYEDKRNLMLSDIAHDLRTPMTTVSGYAKAISDGMVKGEKREEYLEAIQRKSKRVNDLINLLFDYVKLDTDGFKLMKQDIDIAEMVREAGAFIYQDVEDAGMTLDVDIPEEVITVPIDKLQMSRVITNLLTNAIRHNKPGTEVGLYLYREDDYVRILVADNGDKIDKDYAEHIFEPFVVGDESRSTKGGSGLGLSIAKKVVDMHGFDLKLVQGSRLEKYKFVGSYQKAFIIGLKL